MPRGRHVALNADGGIDPVDLAMMQALVKRMAKRLADRYVADLEGQKPTAAVRS